MIDGAKEITAKFNQAIQENDAMPLKNLVQSGIRVSAETARECIRSAIRRNCLPVAKYLLESKEFKEALTSFGVRFYGDVLLHENTKRLLFSVLENNTDDEMFVVLANAYVSEDLPRHELILMAATHGKLAAVKYLQVRTDFVNEAHALSLAAKYNHINVVRHLMQNPAVLAYAKQHYLDENGALSNAIYNGRMDIANLLLSADGANESLIHQNETRLKWALETILSWIAKSNGFTNGNETLVDDEKVHTEVESDETDEVFLEKTRFTDDEKNILSILAPIIQQPGREVVSQLNAYQLRIFNDFRKGESLFGLLMNKLDFLDEAILPIGKRLRPEDGTEYELGEEPSKRSEINFVSENETSFSSLSSSQPSCSSDTSSSNLAETSGLDNFMSEMLLSQIKGLSFKKLVQFILEKNLLTSDIYDNNTWHHIARLLNIKDEWHSELNDDQKLKVDSFFTMMEFAVENYPDTLIHALEIAELVQMPVINDELCRFIVEKNLLTDEAYGSQTWSRIAQLFNIKNEWSSELNDLCTKIDFIAKHFPSPLIEALGLSEMLQMRRLDLGEDTGYTGYLDFLRKKHLGDDNIAIGVDAANRPFVTFMYDTTTRRNVGPHPESQAYIDAQRHADDEDLVVFHTPPVFTQVETLFKRYSEPHDGTWVTGGACGRGLLHNITQTKGHSLHPTLLNFVNRLSHGQTVGYCEYEAEIRDYVEFDNAQIRLARRKP